MWSIQKKWQKKKKKKEKEADIITWERARESDPDREPQWSLSYSDEYQAWSNGREETLRIFQVFFLLLVLSQLDAE